MAKKYDQVIEECKESLIKLVASCPDNPCEEDFKKLSVFRMRAAGMPLRDANRETGWLLKQYGWKEEDR